MASLNTIVERCSYLNEAACNMNVQELKQIYDEMAVCFFSQTLWESRALDYMLAMSKMTVTLESIPHRFLHNAVLLGHKLHFILRNTWIELLWNTTWKSVLNFKGRFPKLKDWSFQWSNLAFALFLAITRSIWASFRMRETSDRALKLGPHQSNRS